MNMGNYVIIMNGEKKMDVNIKKGKLVKYGKGLRFTPQFLPTPSHVVSLEGS